MTAQVNVVGYPEHGRELCVRLNLEKIHVFDNNNVRRFLGRVLLEKVFAISVLPPACTHLFHQWVS